MAKCANCGGNHGAKYRGCTAFKQVQTVIETAVRNKTSYADTVRKIAAGDKGADNKVSHVPTVTKVTKVTTAEIGTQTEIETSTQTIETLDPSLKDAIAKEIADKVETTLSDFKQNMDNNTSAHNEWVCGELRKLRQLIGMDLEADLIERDRKIMELLYVKIRQTARATSRERPQAAAEPVKILTSDEIAAEITALHKPATSMPVPNNEQTGRPATPQLSEHETFMTGVRAITSALGCDPNLFRPQQQSGASTPSQPATVQQATAQPTSVQTAKHTTTTLHTRQSKTHR